MLFRSTTEAANASNKQQVAGLLGGIASGVSSNMMSPEAGIAQLNALRAQGLIDDVTYNAMIKTFPATVKPAVEGPKDIKKTNTGSTVADRYDVTKNPTTTNKILDNLDKGTEAVRDVFNKGLDW